MWLATPDAIRTLQRKLYVKAKTEPAFRFYSLVDKMYRADVLAHAYRVAKANRGAPGVEGQDFAAIESGGLEDWLRQLQEDLRSGAYRPAAVRRVYIPKPGGGERPLGIPTIRDRVAQTAAVIVLAPIFGSSDHSRSGPTAHTCSPPLPSTQGAHQGAAPPPPCAAAPGSLPLAWGEGGGSGGQREGARIQTGAPQSATNRAGWYPMFLANRALRETSEDP